MAKQCEDFPCCGHELNDCDGSKYGSDQAIKEQMWRDMERQAYDYGLDD
jgi:hypothetical protein